MNPLGGFSIFRVYARGALLAPTLVSALALLLTGASACSLKKSDSTTSGANGPVGLSYGQNPALYIIDQPISPNLIQGAVTGNSYKITPSLPAGLTFDTALGAIAGTPTALSPTATYDVEAINSSGVLHISLVLTVGDTPPTMSYGGSFTQTLQVDTPVSIVPALGGGALTGCTSSPALPEGLSLSSSDCSISGTPLVASSSTGYVVTAQNTGGSAALVFNFTVEDIPPTFSFGGATIAAYRGVALSAVSPTSTGGVITSCSVSPSLPAGLSLSNGCVVSGTPTVLTASETYTVTANSYDNSTAGTSSFTLSVTDLAPVITYSGSPYTLTVGDAITTLTPTHTGGELTNCTGTLPPGLSLSSTTCAITGTPTTISGATVYTITPSNTVTGSSVNLTFTVLAQTPTTTYAGSPFTFTRYVSVGTVTPANTGSPILSCASSPSLPAGLSLSSACVITGTPTTPQSATSYTISSTNTGGTKTTSISIAVSEVVPVISYSGTPFTYTVGTPISLTTPSNTGGTITGCTISPALPGGLSLSSACVLSGTPAVISAQTTYTVTASSTAGNGTTTIRITVNNVAPDISYSASPYTYTNGTVIPTLTPANSGGAIVSCAISPAQPAGLSFSTTSCILSGTPTAASSSTNYTITATNTGGSSTAIIAIQVNNAAPTISYSPSTDTFMKGTAITTVTPTLGGGTVTACSSSPALPPGLAISNTTCAITGTPTATVAAASYTITATSSGGSASAVLTLTVNDALPVISYTGSPYTYTTGTAISLNTPTSTGGAITACSSSPTLPTGLSLSSACAISGTPTAVSSSTAYTITASSTGGTGTATINITVNSPAPVISYSASPYTYTNGTAIATLTPANTGGAIASCTISPAQPTGLSFSTANCILSGTPSAASNSTNYTITATNTGGSSTAVIAIQVNNAAPTISYSPTTYTFTKDTAITTVAPTLGGGTVTGCVSSPALPPGLSISNTTCAITGTPTATAAAASYTVTVSSSGGSANAVLSLTVNDALPVISYTGSPYTYTTDTAISLNTPTSTGGAITACSSSPTLPAGLSLSSACAISGAPTTVSAQTTYTITATSTGGTGTATIKIKVNSPAPAISYSASPYSYTKGTAIADLTPVSSGGAIVSCAISPAQPAGLTFSTTTCVLSGTPTAVTAAANYTITATNTGGSSSAIISLSVNNIAPTLSYSTTTFTFTKGTAISTITPTTGGGVITACATSPSLPTGLSISSTTCAITGTPTVVAVSASYVITASNSGGSATATLNLTVNDTLPVISYAGSPFTFTQGTTIATQTPSNTGGAVTACSVNPALPGGLSLSNACVMTGTPTAVTSASTYSVTATNSAGSASTAVTITVKDVAPTLSYTGSPFSYTVGTLVSLSATTGGGTITGCVSSPALPAGLSLSNTTCAISGNPTAVASAANYVITASNSGGTASATINLTVKDIAPSISYAGSPFTFYQNSAISTLSPTATGGAIVSCSATGLPAGLSISASTCAITGTPTTVAAAANVTVSATNTGGTGTATISVKIDSEPPSISYPSSPYTFVKGTVIAAVSPSNTGGAITGCAITPALPAGLALSTTTCVITGTPTAVSSTTTYTVTATDNAGASSATATLNILVINNAPNLNYSAPNQNQVFTKGTAITSFTPTNSGGAITTCTISPSLPAGLALSATTCGISGTPTAVAPSTQYTVTANNTAGSSSAAITLTVNDVAPSITYPGNGGTANTYGFKPNLAIPAVDDPTPTNAGGTIVSCTSATALPSGLSLSDTCVISGTPTTAQTANTYQIIATNSGGTASVTISITINIIYSQVVSANVASAAPTNTPLRFVSLTALNGVWNGLPSSSPSLWSVAPEEGDVSCSLVSEEDAVSPPVTEPGPYAPRISPDGTKVVFASKQTAGGAQSQSYNIWLMNFDGSGKQQLTFNTEAAFDSMGPVFSADGSAVYFASKTDLSGEWNGHPTSSYNIWMISPNGTGLAPITQNIEPGLDSQIP
jgi:hypothetical protein